MYAVPVAVKVAVTVDSLSDESTTRMVTGIAPSPTGVPAAGVCVIVSSTSGVQLSNAPTSTVKSGTSATQLELTAPLRAAV